MRGPRGLRSEIDPRKSWFPATVKGEAGGQCSLMSWGQLAKALGFDEPDQGLGMFGVRLVAHLIIGMLKQGQRRAHELYQPACGSDGKDHCHLGFAVGIDRTAPAFDFPVPPLTALSLELGPVLRRLGTPGFLNRDEVLISE